MESILARERESYKTDITLAPGVLRIGALVKTFLAARLSLRAGEALTSAAEPEPGRDLRRRDPISDQ